MGNKEWRRHIDLLKKITAPPSTDYHLPSPDTQSDEDNLARPPKAEEPMTHPQSAQDELSESDQTREESATPARRYPRRLNRKEPDRYCDTYMNK